MQIVLVTLGRIGPRTASKERRPIVGRKTFALGRVFWRLPHIPIGLRVRLVASALLKPGVLVRGVVDDQVEQQLHVAGVNLADQVVHIGERPVLRIHIFVVADIVAHIFLPCISVTSL